MLADPCTGARGCDFLLGRHRGQLVRAHVPSWGSRHGVDAGCSRRAGPPGQLTARRDQTPAEGTGWTPPDGICVPRWWCHRPLEEASVGQANTIGLDIAKRVFQAHGADASSRVVFRKRLVRAKGLEFFAGQPPVLWRWRLVAGRPTWGGGFGSWGPRWGWSPPPSCKPS